MIRLAVSAIAAFVALLSGLPGAARAEPYLAIMQGLKCSACHVNPTGGGMRNAFGNAFAQNMMAARRMPEGVPAWTGRVGDIVRLGGDLRDDWTRTRVPAQATQQRSEIDQFRLYGDVEVIPGRLGVYVDESLAPGSARTLEAYVRYADPRAGWYLKGGQFYLPFGWRLQDRTAFVREVSGIGMTTPDNGVEFGLERPEWSAQLALTNGSANAASGSGHQLTAQAVWVRPVGRIGAAASSTSTNAGNRHVFGVFAGARTGPLAWLGEVDLVRDDGFPEGRRSQVAWLGEVNWGLRQGHNLKFTTEYFDPDRRVREDHKVRHSLVYEYTPLPFLQLRAGVRRSLGIPQSVFDNRRVLFIEIHAFL